MRSMRPTVMMQVRGYEPFVDIAGVPDRVCDEVLRTNARAS